MTDVVDKKTRSRMMSGIKGKNTKPELLLRSLLHRSGYRFTLHRKDLPGRPDLVLPKHNSAIFVHGCFWHRHDNCHYTSNPASNAEKWEEKFNSNMVRDANNYEHLQAAGWRVLIVWECGLRHQPHKVLEGCIRFLSDEKPMMEELPSILPKPKKHATDTES